MNSFGLTITAEMSFNAGEPPLVLMVVFTEFFKLNQTNLFYWQMVLFIATQVS
jgi:hypothetical protein